MRTVTTFITHFVRGFFSGATPHRRLKREEKHLRAHLDEGQVDSMVDDTFPASDPPSTY